jgi:PEP-CTERM motif-containing protein
MPLSALAHTLVRLRVIASLSLVSVVGCAVVLGAPGAAGASLIVGTFAQGRDEVGSVSDNHNCPHDATSCTVTAHASSPLGVASGDASASASYGSVDGSVTANAGRGPNFSTLGAATASALFSDYFSFLNAAGTATHIEVGFSTNGASVSGASQGGDFAQLDVQMTLQDDAVTRNRAFAEYNLDIEGGSFTSFGLPLDVLSIDVPDGHQAHLTLRIDLEARVTDVDGASVFDPTSVYVLASAPYTTDSGTVYPTAFATAVPEPGSLLLLSSGLALVAWRLKDS